MLAIATVVLLATLTFSAAPADTPVTTSGRLPSGSVSFAVTFTLVELHFGMEGAVSGFATGGLLPDGVGVGVGAGVHVGVDPVAVIYRDRFPAGSKHATMDFVLLGPPLTPVIVNRPNAS